MSLSAQEKFEKKRQKLLEKNARLKGKVDSTSNDYGDYAESNNDSDSDILEWNEMIKLLSTKDIVLRPQELFEYFALLIQSFAGSNIVIVLNRRANILNTSNISNISNTNNVSSIECIVPIINDPRWKSQNDNNNNNELSKYQILEDNVAGFGVLTDRKSLTRRSVESYQITPYFLSNKYEWKGIINNDGIYFSTIYKDYRITGDTKFVQQIVDNTYRKTQNIQEGVIICNNKYGYIPIFSSQNNIFYTDPRIKYKDIKKKWKQNIPKSDIITLRNDTDGNFLKRAAKIGRNNPRLKQKKTTKKAKKKKVKKDEKATKVKKAVDNGDNDDIAMDELKDDGDSEEMEETKLEDDGNKFNVSLSIMDDDDFDDHIIRLWTQSDGKIYVLRADGIMYNVVFCHDKKKEMDEEKKENDDDIKYEGDIDGLLGKLDGLQPNYMIHSRKGAFSTDFTVKTWKKDVNINNMGKAFERKCNKKLKEYKLFEAIKFDTFDMVTYNQRVHHLNRTYDTMHNTLIYGIYYDDDINDNTKGTALYIVQNTFDRINNIHSWDLGYVFNKIDDELIKEYECLYKEFMDKHKYLKHEQCYIMFVDETKLANKQIIIICGKYLVTMNTLRTGIKKQSLFGNVYPLNEIIRDLSSDVVNMRGAKWFYSYTKQTLYVFERLTVSCNYPYRLRRIALSSFQFTL